MSWTDPILLVIATICAWWFTTGLVLLLNRLSPSSFPASLVGGTVVLAASIGVLIITRETATPVSAALGFLAAVGAWFFVELTFYLGYITGPRRHACPAGCGGWRHFLHALETSWYHELLILLITGFLAVLTHDAPNKIGLYTFILLWAGHESARLNVFLGVRNVSKDWVPQHLPFLHSFLTIKPMNAFFPISQLLALPVFYGMVKAAMAADVGSYDATVMIFLSSLLGLAIIEHWFLVLPIPLSGLWLWWMREDETPQNALRASKDKGSRGQSPLRVELKRNPSSLSRVPCDRESHAGDHGGPTVAIARTLSMLGR